GPRLVRDADLPRCVVVYVADLDLDGDPDVLSASPGNNMVAWYENLGGGAFGVQQPISRNNETFGVYSVYAKDLDGDGDLDVLSASQWDDKIAWYENLGAGIIDTIQNVITTSANVARCVYSVDLDNDGDNDVLSANNGNIAWYENYGAGIFGSLQTLTSGSISGISVHTSDLDNDGDQDVLFASYTNDLIAWVENLGGGNFGGQQTISTTADYARDVHSVDLDGDGDMDVLSASQYDNKIAWYENYGAGIFGGEQIISINAYGVQTVFTVDLDNDGDYDVLSASLDDAKVAWYENYLIGAPCSLSPNFTSNDNGNGNYSFTNTSIGSYDESHWAFGDGTTSTSINPSHTFTANDTFVVVLTINDTTYGSSCVDYYLEMINVTGVPNPSQCISGFVMYPDTSTGNVTVVNSSTGNSLTYFWDFGDGDTSTMAYPAHVYVTSGPFYLCLTVDDGVGCIDMYCDSIGVDGVVFKQTGFTINVIGSPIITEVNDEVVNDFGILIYPNPNTGLFTIEKTSDLNKIVEVKVLDATSKLILEKRIPVGKQKVYVDITKYSNGIYYLQLIVDEKVFVKQILKQ
ncbi:MAG: VCBS repeat-containing protein, partial [Flavobacteriales bacterium]|nr:VCBS repeat-containing protein [Flavobacteriales bacterium]